ncbi:MAG: ASCH domain-containing protein [Planctomycetia bacterium]|nr:ASCH domain-containing protein [Planctomycetia bacterium]
MIFQKTWQLVIDGRKTQSRRIVGERLHSWRIGQSYALQPGRGKKAIARIVVTAVRRELLGEITEADAKAEGYDSVADFVSVWESMHGAYDPDTEVFVIEFQLEHSAT